MAAQAIPVMAAQPLVTDTGHRRLPIAATRTARSHGMKRDVVPKDPKRALRRNSLRRAKPSNEELRPTTRTRGGSNATTADSGRSFTVGNINNGIIYLRPTLTRPGNQRRPVPDPFLFSTTPLGRAALDANNLQSPENGWTESLFSGSQPPTRPDPRKRQPQPQLHVKRAEGSRQVPAQHAKARGYAQTRQRSVSANDELNTTGAPGDGTFKVVIERPSTTRQREPDTEPFPGLDISIPHYRLGSPQFSNRGTAILRSSVYTRASGTDGGDPRSSTFSYAAVDDGKLFPSPISFISRRHSDISPQIESQRRLTMHASSLPQTARSSTAPIGPQLYDTFIINPDDPNIVRFAGTGEITAATPSRLIAHITSPSFVDYELLSDFFLTFRSFISPRDLVAYLVARLRWAVTRADDFGRIVRVRSFVALRHWILNYFVEDFVPAPLLRDYFCLLVNSLYEDLRSRGDGGAGDIKIVGELKKCWRRTCALYWDPATVGYDLPDEDIYPCGNVTSTNSGETAGYNKPAPKPSATKRSSKPDPLRLPHPDNGAAKHMDWFRDPRHVPQNSVTSAPFSSEYASPSSPPTSELSMQVLSCSVPIRAFNRGAEHEKDIPLYPRPHPVPVSRTASPKQAPSTKAMRPIHTHKRSGSFSDALRDHRAPLPLSKIAGKERRESPAADVPGSLVRGAVVQPGSPYIDLKNTDPIQSRSQVDLNMEELGAAYGQGNNPAMKRFFGSVRRALSNRQAPGYAGSRLGATEQSSSASAYRASHNATPTTVMTAPCHRKKSSKTVPQVRVDALAAKVGESFRQAVVTELELEKQGRNSLFVTNMGGAGPVRRSLAQEPETRLPQTEGQEEQRGKSEPKKNDKERPLDPTKYPSVVTNGSRSIVIMHDTAEPVPPLNMMSGALPKSMSHDQDASLHQQAVHNFSRPLTLTQKRSTQYGESIIVRDAEVDDSARNTIAMSLNRSSTSQIQHLPSSVATSSVSRPLRRRHSLSFEHRTSTLAPLSPLRRSVSYSSVNSPPQRLGNASSRAYTQSSDNDPFSLEQAPMHKLRRRPGGNLKAVDNIRDLVSSLRQASMQLASERSRSAMFRDTGAPSDYTQYSRTAEERIEQLTSELQKTKKGRKVLDLVDTHSSQPNLRPSFEAEIAKLAALPDEDDEGGIEEALMKLEGTYEKRSPSERKFLSPVLSGHDSRAYTTEAYTTEAYTTEGHSTSYNSSSQERVYGENPRRGEAAQLSAAQSEDSYCSIPLLERGLSDSNFPSRKQAYENLQATAGASPPPTLHTSYQQQQSERNGSSPDSSLEYIVETDSMKRIPRGETMPHSADARCSSFLLNPNVEFGQDTFGGAEESFRTSEDLDYRVTSYFSDEQVDLSHEAKFTHPLRHPPTPPATTSTKPMTGRMMSSRQGSPNDTEFSRGLATPGLSPTPRYVEPLSKPASKLGTQGHSHTASKDTQSTMPLSQSNTPHLPFILAYDSEKLAQQMTIIEKDALDEIDWKELIELRWKQSSPLIQDWVEYLRTQEPHGVDVIIARFNLVVKWAVAEIVLTESPEERVKTIVKYIHIASHARRLRNYATMYQFTVALLSSDVARLTKTWDFVPSAEKQTLKGMEALVQPMRNFHNLRVEMERAATEEGCIPFIGVYTRDLIYNAQKPAFIGERTPGGELLVNFERHHTAAGIVKSLLRLLEASSKYSFKPDPSIISKCLWIACLSDEEIHTRSLQLE